MVTIVVPSQHFKQPCAVKLHGSYLLRKIDTLKLLLALPWVTAAPGRFRRITSHCMLKSFWHEFRTQSSVYPNFLSVCVASLPWPRQRNVLFSCRIGLTSVKARLLCQWLISHGPCECIPMFWQSQSLWSYQYLSLFEQNWVQRFLYFLRNVYLCIFVQLK